jgi:hypothetical protein
MPLSQTDLPRVAEHVDTLIKAAWGEPGEPGAQDWTLIYRARNKLRELLPLLHPHEDITDTSVSPETEEHLEELQSFLWSITFFNSIRDRRKTVRACLGSIRDSLRGLEDPPPAPKSVLPAPVLKPGDREILESLAKSASVALSLYDLETATGLNRKTLSDRVNYLITHKLADRPRGQRSGVAITPAGRKLLALIGAR